MRQLLFCAATIILSATGTTAQQTAFNGRFSAVSPLDHSTVLLSLSNINDRVTGNYSAPENPGAVYRIAAVVIDGVLKGRMTDMHSGIWNFRFTAIPRGDGFYFKLYNKFWTSVIPEMLFKPSANAEPNPAAGFDPGSQSCDVADYKKYN